jgi:hypothetical protein
MEAAIKKKWVINQSVKRLLFPKQLSKTTLRSVRKAHEVKINAARKQTSLTT